MRRGIRLNVILFTAVVTGIGFLTTAGLIVQGFEADFGIDLTLLTVIAQVFIRLAVITTAMTILIGIFNLLYVHLRRILGRDDNPTSVSTRLNSLVLIVSFGAGIVTAGTDIGDVLLNDVQLAIESALAGLLFFVLVWGGMHVLRRDLSLNRFLFVLSMLMALLLALPWGFTILTDIQEWFMRVPVGAGARGILLGIGLATLITGVRVLIGQDRSYGE